MSNGKPSEPGLYWARTGAHRWYNVIVEVVGTAPWLEIGNIFNRGGMGFDASDIVFGPKIIEPEVQADKHEEG
jgi:hypothetical protein